jgi:hypothetical protein
MVHARSAFLCCGGEKLHFVAADPIFENRTSLASTRQSPIVHRRSGGGIVMYLAVVVLLMGVLPAVSIVAEAALSHGGADLTLLIGKWFVFWSVGVRLILAGLRQTANPSFTAESIFEVRDKGAFTIVRELGFGNLSIGLLGGSALFNPGWITPAAVAGGLFYGLTGAQHLMKGNRNAKETIAMVSDLFIFLVLAVFLLALLFRPG